MSVTQIRVRVVRAMPTELAKQKFAHWFAEHKQLVERLPHDAITVSTIRGSDAHSGRAIDKLQYEVAMNDEWGEMLAAGEGNSTLEVLLPSDSATVARWWSMHQALSSKLQDENVLARDPHFKQPTRFLLTDKEVALLRADAAGL